MYVTTTHSPCLHRDMNVFNPMAASRAVAAETDAALHHRSLVAAKYQFSSTPRSMEFAIA